MANPDRPPGPPNPPAPGPASGRGGPASRRGRGGRQRGSNRPVPSDQRGIQDYFRPQPAGPSRQPGPAPGPSQQPEPGPSRQPVTASGRDTGTNLPASSSHPELARVEPSRSDSPSRRADFPQGRPWAPTMESLTSGLGSLNTLEGRPSGSPARSRTNTDSSQTARPSTPSRVPPSSPSLGRGSPRVPPAASTQAPKILFKTFRVIKSLSAAEAESLNLNRPAPGGFVKLDIGDFGVVPNIPENVVDGDLAPYPRVQMFRQGQVREEPRPGMPFGDGKCRVPKSNIAIGAFVRETKELFIEADPWNPNLRLQVSNDNSPFKKLLESFLASLSEGGTQAQLKRQGVPAEVAEVVLEPNRCRVFVNELLSDGLPQISTIWNSLRYVNPETNPVFREGTYFYVIIYHNEKTGTSSIYVGRTSNPTARYIQHSRCLSGNNQQLMHYIVARKKLREGATYRLIPIAFLPKNMPNAFRAWAETILAVLFNSFSPIMLSIKSQSASNEFTTDEFTLRRSLKYDYYLQASGAPLAKVLQTVAKQIKNSHPSLKSFDSNERSTGLNWSVPIAEGLMSSNSNLWVRTATHGDANTPALWSFRTHPRRLTKERFITIFYGHASSLPVRFRPVAPKECTSLVPGSVVNVVVEITIDPNTRHPYTYARMPTVGPFDCWNEASRVAVRIEFEDEQGWHTKYLKQEKVQLFTARIKLDPREFGDEVNHIENSWIHGMKILATLLNWHWDSDNVLAKRVWAPYSSNVRVIESGFFNQRLVVGGCPPTSKPIPRLLTLDETAQLIEARFGSDVIVGTLPSYAVINTGPAAIRKKCDLCLMGDRGNQMLALPRKCKDRWVVKEVDGGHKIWQCAFSAMLNRYCT
ncbi:unnamed protein product [Fusarium langsethiae]|nr:unnamed protein product [Fusarium langsethiae]